MRCGVLDMPTKIRKLGEVTDVRDGTHDSPKYQTCGFPLVTTRCFVGDSLDITQAKLISGEDYDAINVRSKVDQYDILISMIGTVGAVYQETSAVVRYAIKNVGLIKCHGDAVLSDWIFYWLKSDLGIQAISERLRGTTQKFISLTDLRHLPIGELPNNSIMQERVSILKKIDAKIKLNQQINNNLLQMMDLIWRHARKDRLTKLGDISNIRAGKRPIDRYEAFQEGLVPLVGGSGMMGWTSQSLVKTPIITTGRVGANIGTNGVTHMFDYPVWVSDNSLIITSNYLPVVFEMLRCDVDFSSLIHGTSQPLITQSDLKQYKVLLPDERRLNRINSYFLAITNLIEGNKAENRILSTVRDLMLPKLLAGDIDLSNIETVMNNA